MPARAGTFLPDSLDLTRLLPPPPSAENSAAEIALLHRRQEARTPAEVARARADVDETVLVFANLFGPAFSATILPLTADLFARVTEDAVGAIGRAKAVWQRARPAALDPTLSPCVPTPATAAYPGGHAALGMLYALLLSDMLPEWRERLHARAREYAAGREICGIHYPSDTAAGEMAAAAIAAILLDTPAFARRADAARREVRAALGLPAAPPLAATALPEGEVSEDFRVR